jgi:hypothetical protein
MSSRRARCPTCGTALGNHGLHAGGVAGDPNPLAAAILRRLRAAPGGMPRSDLCRAFGGRVAAARIGVALAELARRGLAEGRHERTGGRSAERWRATA